MAKPRRRGNSYQLRATVNGVTKTRSWQIPSGLSAKQAEKQAMKEQAKFEELIQKGINTDKITFAQIAEQYIDFIQDSLKPTTVKTHEDRIKLINPYIGHIEIKRLTKQHIRDYIAELEKPYTTKTGIVKTRSAATIHDYYKTISSVLTFACEQDYLEDNICTMKGIRLPKLTDKQDKAIPIDTVQAYIDLMATAPLQDKLFFYLALYSGARKGEILGLSWDNIDFDSQEITISANAQYVSGKGIIYITPKSTASERTISLPPEVFDMLRQMKTQQAENRLKAGHLWKANPSNPAEHFCENHASCNRPCAGFCSKNCKMFKDGNRIFLNELGAPIHPDTPRKSIQKLGKRAGLPKITVHQLRHTLVSLAIANGDPLTQIAAFVGHSSPRVTTGIYAHAVRKAGQARTLNTNINNILKIAQ